MQNITHRRIVGYIPLSILLLCANTSASAQNSGGSLAVGPRMAVFGECYVPGEPILAVFDSPQKFLLGQPRWQVLGQQIADGVYDAIRHPSQPDVILVTYDNRIRTEQEIRAYDINGNGQPLWSVDLVSLMNGGAGPADLEPSPSGTRIFFQGSLYAGGAILGQLDLKTHQVESLGIGQRARGDLLFDPVGDRLFEVGGGSNMFTYTLGRDACTALGSISGATERSLFIANSAPHQMKLRPESRHLWVAHQGGITIVDVSQPNSEMIVDAIPFSGGEPKIEFAPDGKVAYYAQGTIVNRIDSDCGSPNYKSILNFENIGSQYQEVGQVHYVTLGNKDYLVCKAVPFQSSQTNPGNQFVVLDPVTLTVGPTVVSVVPNTYDFLTIP